MKNIYYILLTMLAMSFAFTACSEDNPFSTVTANDEPRILDPIFPDGKDGKLPVIAEMNRDAPLSISLTVTPANNVSISWLIDGHEVETGKTIDIYLKAGTYKFKVMVTTDASKSTYREGTVLVKPLVDDPSSTAIGVERIVIPGAKARFYGSNLDKVKSVIIDNKTITDIAHVGDGNYLEYTVPADLDEGEHRVIFVDNNSFEYGANTITVTQATLITAGVDRTNANREWTITGLNLDLVTSLTFAEQTITEFTKQTATEIVITCPDLQDGEYRLIGKTKSGENVQFYTAKGIVAEHTVIVSSETILWEGHHYVSWDLPDESPNKKFDLIGKEVFASMKAGATLSIHYSVNSQDDYHQLRTTSGHWADLPSTAVIEFSEGGVKEVQLTQAVLDKIQAEDGFLCIGHGYYVDMVTVQ